MSIYSIGHGQVRVYRGTGVSRGVRRTTWERSQNNWELQISCFEELLGGENVLGLVPASLPHTLGYACTFTPPLPLPQLYFSANKVYPYPLGAGSARPNPQMGAPDPENPLVLGFSVLGGGLRPWSQTMVSEGARPWGRGRSGYCEFCGSEKSRKIPAKFPAKCSSQNPTNNLKI